MPHSETKSAWIDFAESKKKHGENKQWLYNADSVIGKCSCPFEKRDIDINKISRDTGDDGNDKGPVP